MEIIKCNATRATIKNSTKDTLTNRIFTASGLKMTHVSLKETMKGVKSYNILDDLNHLLKAHFP